MRRTALFMPSLLVAVIAGMSSAPQVASGASHRTDRQRLLVLKAKVRDLKEQVRTQQRALDGATGQIAALTRDLATRTAERDRAVARGSALQATLDSRPSALTAGTG